MQAILRLRSGGAWLAPLMAAFALLAAPAAQAGLFDDDEARRAILDLRGKLEENNKLQAQRQAETNAQLMEQISLLKRSLLDLNSQIELMRADAAKLVGQNEQLTRDVAELQRRQKDIAQGVDDRIRKLEPQKVTLDDKEFLVDPEEKKQFDDAMAVMRKGDFAGAAAAFVSFRQRYPASGYNDVALFWLGNAQYGKREYREATASFRELLKVAPDSPRAPEALLSIANCQMELKDTKGARRTLDDLLKTYPKSEAAQAGKERLASMKG